MSKTKIRIDSAIIRDYAFTADQLRFEDFLQSLADDGWELLEMIPLGGGYVITVHRKVKKWWQQ